jgi:hypothetical protein
MRQYTIISIHDFRANFKTYEKKDALHTACKPRAVRYLVYFFFLITCAAKAITARIGTPPMTAEQPLLSGIGKSVLGMTSVSE